MRRALAPLATVVLAAAFASCGSEVTLEDPVAASGSSASTASAGGGAGGGPTASVATSSSGAGGSPSSTSSTSSTSSGAGGSICPAPPVSVCVGHVYACGDAVDNDGDGLADAADPDCLGACDNTEDGFHHGIPGDGPGCLVDCYYDQDSGTGNDGCHWNHRCDPKEVAPDYFPNPWSGEWCAYDPAASTPGTDASCAELSAAQSPECMAYCAPLVPNGCDCFGCCEWPMESGSFVYLGGEDENGSPACDRESLDDPWSCHPCTPTPGCFNACDPCEICVFRPELDPSCPAPSCPGGVEPCAGDCKECPEGSYCITGCCVPVPL